MVLANEKQQVSYACVVAWGDRGGNISQLSTYYHRIIRAKHATMRGVLTDTGEVVFAIAFPSCPLSFMRAVAKGNPFEEYRVVCVPRDCPLPPCEVISKRKSKQTAENKKGG